MAILKVNGKAPITSLPPLPPPLSTDLTQFSGAEVRAALLNDYSFTIFWPFAKFVTMIHDLQWLRERIDDPALADHPMLDNARSDASRHHAAATKACHGLVSDEAQASRLWVSLNASERAQHGCDASWDVAAGRPDLIGVIWDTWAPGQFPEGWTLRSFLALHENDRPAYVDYRRRGIIDTPVFVGAATAAAKAREIRKRKFEDHYERMKR